MTRFIFLIMLACLFSIIASFSRKSQNLKTFQLQSDTSQYTVIKFNKSYYWIFKNVTPTTLTAKEIEVTEGLLKKAVQAYNKDQKRDAFTIRSLEEYKRQFIPVINNKGEKEVWVNCLCDVQEDRWRNEIILVADGGNCYFNLKINLTAKSFYEIAVNGYA